jgi:hypothetical protein
MTDAWPFADPRNVAVFTVRDIMDMRRSILLVHHDAEDGGWQFLTGEPLEMKDAMLVGLAEVVRLDPTVAALADLPLGWQATRARVGDDWHRSAASPA